MKWFFNLKIATKLISCFILVALVAGIVGMVGIIDIRNIVNLDKDMYERHTATMPELAIVIDSFQRTRAFMRDMIIDSDEGKRASYMQSIYDLDEAGLASFERFDAQIQEPEIRAEFDDLKATILNEFFPYREEFFGLIQAGKAAEATTHMYNQGTVIITKVQDSIAHLQSLKVNLAKQSSDQNMEAANSATMIMIVVIAIGIIFAISLGIFIAKTISNPVKNLAEAANKLALGDINVDVQATSKDEIGNLMESFRKMIENIRGQALAVERLATGDLTVKIKVKSDSDLLGNKLNELIDNNNEVLNNINAAAEQVAAGARQVSDSSMALSQGTTEQASSIEQLTASLEEISSQTDLNAKNAEQANHLAETAKNNAIEGNIQMKEMLKAMEEINESSANISKIIKVIDDIAFQTNILSLNAAVEAARAGQHGKGFAVVAEEVRNLAARSANAAKETTDMIESSIKKTEAGTKIAQQTAEALNEIVSEIEKAANLVGDIAEASNEQAVGIGQINQGVMQVSQVVQNNSATSEESAAASEELSSQAELLKDMVGKFKLKKVNQSNNKFNDISPDVLKLLEEMADKRRTGLGVINDSWEEAAVSKPSIILSDKEFGKY